MLLGKWMQFVITFKIKIISETQTLNEILIGSTCIFHLTMYTNT